MGQLKQLYRDPQISVSVIKLKSRTVSVLGAVNNPGIQALEGRRTILDVLAAAGGLRQDAGTVVELTRPSVGNGLPPGHFDIHAIALASLLEAKEPQANIDVMPGDMVTVPKGKMIYVVGEVKRPGGFAVGESDGHGFEGAVVIGGVRKCRESGARTNPQERRDGSKVRAKRRSAETFRRADRRMCG